MQTLRFEVSVHLYQVIIFYSVPVVANWFIKKKSAERAFAAGIANDVKPPVVEFEKKEPEKIIKYTDTILVNVGGQYITIAVPEILYFSASSPYVTIHLRNKKYLHTRSLAAMGRLVDPGRFIRVHKSHIVNIGEVQGYKSRLNGDYDLTLNDGTVLRVSRNYAKAFKLLVSR